MPKTNATHTDNPHEELSRRENLAAAPSPPLSNFIRSYFTPAGKEAAWNLGGLIAGTVVSQVCGFVVILLLTRALDSRQFGIYAVAINLYAYMVLFANFGMEPIVVRELHRRPGRCDQITTAYLSISLAAGLFVAAITLMGSFVAETAADEAFVLVCLALAIITTCGRMTPFFDALHRQSLTGLMSAIVDLFWLGTIIWLDVMGTLGLYAVGVVLLARLAVSNLFPLAVYHFRHQRVRIRFDTSEVLTILGSARHLLVMQLAATIPLSAGVFLVRFFHGEAAAGVMGLAMFAAQAFLHLVAMAIRIVYPYITGPYGVELQFRRKLWAFVSCYILLLCAVTVIGLAVVVRWVLGPAYSAVLPLGICLIIGSVPLGFAWLMIQLLVAQSRGRAVSTAQVVAATVFLVVAVPGTWHASYTGVAVAFCSSSIAMLVISWALCFSRLNQGTTLDTIPRDP